MPGCVCMHVPGLGVSACVCLGVSACVCLACLGACAIVHAFPGLPGCGRMHTHGVPWCVCMQSMHMPGVPGCGRMHMPGVPLVRVHAYAWRAWV